MNWFYNLKVTSKLLLAFILVSAITATVGIMGIHNMAEINAMADKMYQNDLLGLSYVKEANINLVYIGRAEKNLLLATSQEERETHRANIAKYKQSFQECLDKTRKTLSTEEGRTLLAKVESAWKDFDQANQQVVNQAFQEELHESRKSLELAAQGRQKSNILDQAITELADMKETFAQKASEETTSIYQSSRTFMIALVAGSIFLGIAIGIFIARVIANPLKLTMQMIQGMESGRVNQRLQIHRKDEIGEMAQSMDRFADSLEQEVVGSLQKLAAGDLTFQVAPRDGQDVVRGALKKLGEDLGALVAQIARRRRRGCLASARCERPRGSPRRRRGCPAC
jgi:methyl-accepting chemotaxis protein